MFAYPSLDDFVLKLEQVRRLQYHFRFVSNLYKFTFRCVRLFSHSLKGAFADDLLVV